MTPNRQYRKYHIKILLVEYRKCEAINLAETWDHIHAEIFNFQEVGDMMANIQSCVRETGNSEILFVVGHKVTGYMHVLAGKSSFGAPVHPLLPDLVPFIDDRKQNEAPQAHKDISTCQEG